MRRGIVLATLLAATPAAADSNDLVLSRLGTRITDSMGNLTGVVGDNVEFRSLASQLGVALAPHLLTPADSIGFSGFQMTVDYATTTIDTSAPYWRVLQGTVPTALQTVG